MPLFKQKTLSMAAGGGYLVDFSAPVGLVSIKASAECWIRVSNTTGSAAPTATPAPASGAQASWLHLDEGDAVSFGVDPAYTGGALVAQDQIQYVEVWAIGAGLLTLSAH